MPSLTQVEELRASERNLKIRVKSLTNELAIMKRQGRLNYSGSSTKARESNSRENSFNSRFSGSSRRSRERSLEGRSNSFVRGRNLSGERSTERPVRSHNSASRLSRERSSSREKPFIRNGRTSRENSLTKARSSSTERGRSLDRPRSAGYRNRTPSPAFSVSSAGARTPRFDPTAYIKEKERKSRESYMKMRRQERSLINGSTEGRFVRSSPAGSNRAGRSRASSTGSLRSRTSSVESLSDGVTSDITSNRRMNSALKTKRSYSTRHNPSSPDISFSRKSNLSSGSGQKKLLSSTPEKYFNKKEKSTSREKENKVPSKSNDYYDRSQEISEIDARLNRLQQFMNTNLALS